MNSQHKNIAIGNIFNQININNLLNKTIIIVCKSDKVGPGSYDIEPSKKRSGSSSKNKEQSYRARLIFDLIRSKVSDIITLLRNSVSNFIVGHY